MFGLENVRPALQQIGRKIRGQIAGEILFVQRFRKRQIVGQGLADEQDQGVLCLRALAFVNGDVSASGLYLRCGGLQIEFRRRASIEAVFVQVVGGLNGSKGLAGQRELFVQLAFGEVLNGHLRNQRDVHAPAGFLGGKIIFESLLIETAHATEEVNFIRGAGETHVVLIVGDGPARAVDVAGRPLACDARAGRNRRQ